MTQLDSARLRFFKVASHDCCHECYKIVAHLEIDFGSSLPEIEACGGIKPVVKGDLDRWILGNKIPWVARRGWARVSLGTTRTANEIVSGWILRGREQLRNMTARNILECVNDHKSIEVHR